MISSMYDNTIQGAGWRYGGTPDAPSWQHLRNEEVSLEGLAAALRYKTWYL